MKKLFAIFCCLIVGTMGLVLTGCGGDKYADDAHVGTWKATTAEMSGVTLQVSDILGSDFIITLEASGACTVTVDGEDTTGDWEPTDGGFKIVDADQEMEFADDGDNIVLDYEGLKMTFEKQ